MNKYRVGRKQKRVILDENGHEVAIFNRKNSHLAQLCCDSLNKFFNGDTVKFCEECLAQGCIEPKYKDGLCKYCYADKMRF